MTALAKVQCTKLFEYCARESAQIFGGLSYTRGPTVTLTLTLSSLTLTLIGGLSYTRGGQGEKVERLNREVRAMAVPHMTPTAL